MSRGRKHLITSLGVLLAGTAAGSAGALAQQIGTTSAVKPATTGTRPTGQIRILQIGADLVHKERVTTAIDGAAQVLFIDKSTLNVGPDSDVLIDEYVYNPNAGTGRMAATLAKGALRFVGGQISHTEGMTIKTPSGSVGVRGGVAHVEVRDGKVKIIPLYGSVTYVAPGTAPVRINIGEKLEVAITPAAGGGGSSGGGPAATPPVVTTVSQGELAAASAVVSPPPGPLPNTALVLGTGTSGSSISNIGSSALPPPPPPAPATLRASNPQAVFTQQQVNTITRSSTSASPPPPPPPPPIGLLPPPPLAPPPPPSLPPPP